MKSDQQKIKQAFETMTKKSLIHEAILHVENMNGDFSYSKGYGGRDIDSPLLMASITKLFTTSCILILQEQGKLSLNDMVTKYIKEETLHNLHFYKGEEYSMKLTVSHLLFQTSGIPDIFEEGRKHAKSRALSEDTYTNLDEKIAMTKKLKPYFAPGMGKRAHYSNINFDILGEIIEKVSNRTLAEVYEDFIFHPLELTQTYLPTSDDDYVPKVYYKDTAFHRPKTVRSSRASGGCISTARDLMIFLKAFFGGRLFNENLLHELKVTNKLQGAMYPIHYDAGYMKIPLNGPVTLFQGKGELIGHSGSTGSFAFYYPEKELFFTGDLNQMANPALPIRLVIRLALSMEG